MESLIPLIIAVLISAVLSAKKKKQKSYPEHKTTLPESPWDDLIRELKGGSESAEAKSAPQTVRDEPRPALRPVQAVPEPPSGGSRSVDPIADAVPFSYDDQAIAEAEERLNRIPAIPALRLAEPLQPAAPFREGNAAAAGGSRFFPDGFDARAAVIYAEIMRPKYQDY